MFDDIYLVTSATAKAVALRDSPTLVKTPAPSYGATFGRFTPSLRTYLGASYIHLRPVCRLRSPALAVADVTK